MTSLLTAPVFSQEQLEMAQMGTFYNYYNLSSTETQSNNGISSQLRQSTS